ncbi:hypothetical protein OSCT_2771 [Oscillochloris trichoides DG-6]|uniref:Uncharacterized protein n=1 Tax=Oscillochloris trichoides DG-6 TaxID=765420 RepID=E1IHH0_9CHLR|nr:hypothetical protein [Oscillochloris trichoides]EFO79333.1 hypothetical protein OSCT_2771 [Oscillochloris trichoides DG-6]
MIVPSLTTITIERRGYGRRYSDLPVDHLDIDGFVIDCSGAYTRPNHYDLRVGDIVRWRNGDQILEAIIAGVERSNDRVTVTLRNTTPLPDDFFFY